MRTADDRTRWPRVLKSAGCKLAKNGLQDSKTYTFPVIQAIVMQRCRRCTVHILVRLAVSPQLWVRNHHGSQCFYFGKMKGQTSMT
jgi:hypothetical protein